MGPNQTYMLLHSKGNHKQKDNLHNGIKYFTLCNQQGLNFQNMQTAHSAQYLKNSKMARWYRYFSEEDMQMANR